MKILDAHLTRRLVTTLFKTILALVILFMVIDLLTSRRTEILDHDVPALVVARYYLLLVPEMLVGHQLAALAMLVSTLLVFGSAAQHNELNALFASGVSLRRIVLLPALIAAGLAAVLFLIGESIGPAAARETRAIESQYFGKNVRGASSVRSGISWSNLADGWKCHITKFNRIAMTGEDVVMLALRPDKSEQIRARRIYWDETIRRWILEDGMRSVFYPEEGMAFEALPIKQWPAPIRETPEELFAPFEDPATRSSGALRRVIAEAEEKGIPLSRLKVGYHGKFAGPVLPFVMLWLAAPFATRLRRGGLAVGFGLSIALGLAYLLVSSGAQALGYTERLTPVAAAWSANAIFLGAGLALMARTRT